MRLSDNERTKCIGTGPPRPRPKCKPRRDPSQNCRSVHDVMEQACAPIEEELNRLNHIVKECSKEEHKDLPSELQSEVAHYLVLITKAIAELKLQAYKVWMERSESEI